MPKSIALSSSFGLLTSKSMSGLSTLSLSLLNSCWMSTYYYIPALDNNLIIYITMCILHSFRPPSPTPRVRVLFFLGESYTYRWGLMKWIDSIHFIRIDSIIIYKLERLNFLKKELEKPLRLTRHHHCCCCYRVVSDIGIHEQKGVQALEPVFICK